MPTADSTRPISFRCSSRRNSKIVIPLTQPGAKGIGTEIEKFDTSDLVLAFQLGHCESSCCGTSRPAETIKWDFRQ